MNLSRNDRLAVVFVAALAALAVVLSDAVGAAKPVTASLKPLAASRVSGTVSLAAAGRGTTVTLTVRGLPPWTVAYARLHAGTRITQLSASAARLPDLRADARGTARATGRVLFRGREPVQLSAIADGEHIVVVVVRGRIVAYGLIPRD